jgi:dienelactone hydrolase|tara:strand:- start:2723 stop:3886 length:1164 start_codon:yes stop_codon:yes gene_type:complete
MFEYFPDNYSWSLTTATLFDEVGTISEPEEALRAVKHLAGGDKATANEAWYEAFTKLAEKLERLGNIDLDEGHPLTAARKYHRAGIYYLRAERFLHHTDPRELMCYNRGINIYRKAREVGRDPVEYVDVPFEGGVLPCMFVKANVDVPAPVMIHIQGFDSLKEFHYPIIGEEYRKRGMHMLIVDQPGSGGALRLHNLTADHETEHCVKVLVDYVQTRSDVDIDRIGLSGNSLGGYYAPRAAAFEKRIKCCIAWGALYDFGILFESATNKQMTAPSVPDVVSHGMWVTGQNTPEAALKVTRKMTLEGIVEKITCPLLVAHGENDRQVPLWMAERTFEEAINSPNRKLKIFTLEEGGAEHCQIDNRQLIGDVMSDWAAEIFGLDPAGIK